MHGDVSEDRIDQTAIARVKQVDRECRTDNYIPDQYAAFHTLRSISPVWLLPQPMEFAAIRKFS